jgi:NTP pyrophosphatase (non-canonical NTP hydrolase)
MKESVKIIPERVRKVSLLEKKTLVERGLKLNEEAGELAAEILKLRGLKGAKGKTKKEILYDLHLEAVDCLLMSMDILVHTGASEGRIRSIMESQLDKWTKGIKK